MSQTFPEASVQNLTGSWWQTASGGALRRGSLVWAIVPYPDMKCMRLIPEGRGDDARQHIKANYRVEEFRTGDPVKNVSPLPVAGLPMRSGEAYLVRRGKMRPAIVLAMPGVDVPEAYRRGGSKWQYNAALLMAPYYGVESDGNRGGWNPDFVSRIQRAEYCQYIWDILPMGGSAEGSILRVDHIFPAGDDPSNWKATDYALRDDALSVIDEWVCWHVTGAIPAGGVVECCREAFGQLSA